MENNNYQQPREPQQTQTVYQTPNQLKQPGYQFPDQYQLPQADPNYAAIVKDFLTKAIVSCAISSLPVGSIIAIFMATKNRKALLEYLDKGGVHTIKMKVCSALSRAGRYAGIGYTIFWALYLLYFLIWIAVGVFAIIAQTQT